MTIKFSDFNSMKKEKSSHLHQHEIPVEGVLKNAESKVLFFPFTVPTNSMLEDSFEICKTGFMQTEK